MLEQLEFVVEMIDGSPALAFAEAPYGPRGQYDDPQYG